MLLIIDRRVPKLLDEGNRLNSDNIESFSAPYVLASHGVVTPDHVALGLGKAGPIAVIGSSGKLCLLSSYNPVDLVLGLLAAMRTRH
ncbi:MAG TPA: hypothetical protein VNU92_11095 [Edaphobacter sp.]|nr:hypothetical protein [Edaphobacter sp.]